MQNLVIILHPSMDGKKCTGCSEVKAIDCFWKKKNRLQSRCIECQKTYHVKHYKAKKKQYVENASTRNKKIRSENRLLLDQIKSETPCKDCNKSYPPWVMDFDHVDASNKIDCVGRMIGLSKKAILEEIKKCEIVCANCHRQRTHDRGYVVVAE